MARSEGSSERKPLARLERRDVYRGLRFTETEDREYQDAAVARGIDFSSYLRECIRRGHMMHKAEQYMKQAGG